MFRYGDIVIEDTLEKSALDNNPLMFIQEVLVDKNYCVVYDLFANRLNFMPIKDLTPRVQFIGLQLLEINPKYIRNDTVRCQLEVFMNQQEQIAMQKYVFLKGTIDRGVTLNINNKKWTPSGVYFQPYDRVYWQDMIVFTGWSSIGYTDDILLSTLLPNSRYLTNLVEID
jgi:hypothetical protein